MHACVHDCALFVFVYAPLHARVCMWVCVWVVWMGVFVYVILWLITRALFLIYIVEFLIYIVYEEQSAKDKPAETCMHRMRGCVCLHGLRHARVCMHKPVCV